MTEVDRRTPVLAHAVARIERGRVNGDSAVVEYCLIQLIQVAWALIPPNPFSFRGKNPHTLDAATPTAAATGFLTLMIQGPSVTQRCAEEPPQLPVPSRHQLVGSCKRLPRRSQAC